MNELLSIEVATTSSDGYGGQLVSWAEDFKWWARVTPNGGAEVERLGRLVTVEQFTAVGRFDSRITTAHRAKWGDRYFNIRSAQNLDGRRRETTLDLESGVADAS